MNAPLQTHERNALGGTLCAFAFFHLNLAFSSIEEEKRGEVIERCYWPLLKLAERHPIGVEISGYTLEEIAARDSAWIACTREMIAQGRIDLIGSGYSQMIGPLVPGRVTAENLKLGNAIYRDLLGIKPTIALVNEQTYSAGLVGHYLDAGYSALLMDWDNPAPIIPNGIANSNICHNMRWAQTDVRSLCSGPIQPLSSSCSDSPMTTFR